MPGRVPLASTQVEYSLLNRAVEHEVLPAAAALGLGVLPWSPLGRGVLTGKYRTGTPSDSRAASSHFANFVNAYLDDRSAGIVEAEYTRDNLGHVSEVRIVNVPSFLHSSGLTVDVPDLGRLVFDVAYGGNFYVIIEPQESYADLGARHTLTAVITDSSGQTATALLHVTVPVPPGYAAATITPDAWNAGTVLVGQDAGVIADALARHAPDVPVIRVGVGETSGVAATVMDRVAAEAVRLARPGDAILLAPGCASMDMFTDYGARGDAFAEAVRRRQ